MSPEVLMQSQHVGSVHQHALGYDFGADYWSLGCILFEFLCGYPPFAGPTMEEVFVNVYHWQEVLARPHYDGADAEFNLSDEAWDLIQKLITFRKERIVSMADVQLYPWFDQMTGLIAGHLQCQPNTQFLWQELRRIPETILKPPFVPRLASETDHSLFDDFTDEKSQAMYKEVFEKQQRVEAGPNVPAGDRLAFVGFTFKHLRAHH
jgi:serine/threonine protein kinase